MTAVVGYQPNSRKQDSRFSYNTATILIELGFQRTQVIFVWTYVFIPFEYVSRSGFMNLSNEHFI